MKTVIVVESPAKARKIKTFFKDETIVTSSFGHIIDLPKEQISIDIENNFKPNYQPIKEKRKLSKNYSLILKVTIFYWLLMMIGRVTLLHGTAVK